MASKKPEKDKGKKKSKVKEGDIKLMLLVTGALAIAASHYMVHDPLSIEIEALEKEIATEQAEKDRLTIVEQQKPILEAETVEYRVIVENEMLKYPEDVLTETYMMYADTMRNQLGISISGVTIGAPAQISVNDIMRHISSEDVEQTIASYRTTLSFAWEFSYPQLKSFIDYVHADRERTVIETLAISYNGSTGQLIGNTVINKYFIATPEYVYIPADIPIGATGTDNPFGTLLEG